MKTILRAVRAGAENARGATDAAAVITAAAARKWRRGANMGRGE
jgi:hypothetical protein